MSTRQPPFGRHPGETPALSDADVRDIVAFLNALSDGYAPAQGRGECRRLSLAFHIEG